jgi:hypothetical protein
LINIYHSAPILDIYACLSQDRSGHTCLMARARICV